MTIPGRIKGITGDFLYSMMGLVVMNGVIQLLLYPFLNRELGAEQFGSVLSLLSIVAIMGATFGTAANYSRMVSHTKGVEVRGDYNLFLAMVGGISLVVSAAGLLWLGMAGWYTFFGYYLLMGITVLRYYADVEFRLNLNYKRFFIYYLLISVGYVAGVVLFPLTKSWILTMLIGELLAVLYVIFRGRIFTAPLFQRSPNFKANMKSMVILSGTELIATLILNADRLLLQVFAGGVAVTVFYTATLIGKIISLISMPLNGVIMGHLANYKGRFSSAAFLKLCSGGVVLGLLMNAACVGVSYVFVKLMYADIFELVKPYFWLANLGQVFYFISNTLTVILLRFTEEKYQLYINLFYLAAFALLAIPMTAVWALWGMAWALVIVNLLKIAAIMAVGKMKLKDGRDITA